MDSPCPSSIVLLIATSWNTASDDLTSQPTGSLVKDFCQNTLKSDEVYNLYCTVLDVEVSSDQKEDAENVHITLIPATRSKWLNPGEDQPDVHWLVYHDKYYPQLKDLQHVKHVVSLSPKTKNGAAAIHENLFPKAEIHQLSPPEPDGVLFAFNAWNKEACGLTGYHRAAIHDFCVRKVRTGGRLKAFSTVLDVKLTEDQKKDAKNCGVTLIPAQRKEGGKKKRELPTLDWLLNHESHYPDLRKLQNIKFVVGYAPKTAWAAIDIHNKLFPEAKLVLINHAFSERNCLSENGDEEDPELENDMLIMASKADMLFSIGPKIYDFFKNAYRADINGRQLVDIPHEEILPKPRQIYYECKPVIVEDMVPHSLLTYGQLDSLEAVERCTPIAAAVGTVANIRETAGQNITEWKICGVSAHESKQVKSTLIDKMLSGKVLLRLYSSSSASTLLQHIQQSHLCLPPSCYTDYSFEGLEAMAAGLPTTVQDDSHIAAMIKRHFKEHADYCIDTGKPDSLAVKITNNLINNIEAFKNADKLKGDLTKNEAVTERFAKFASIFTEEEAETRNSDKTEDAVNSSFGEKKMLTTEENHETLINAPSRSESLVTKAGLVERNAFISSDMKITKDSGIADGMETRKIATAQSRIRVEDDLGTNESFTVQPEFVNFKETDNYQNDVQSKVTQIDESETEYNANVLSFDRIEEIDKNTGDQESYLRKEQGAKYSERAKREALEEGRAGLKDRRMTLNEISGGSSSEQAEAKCEETGDDEAVPMLRERFSSDRTGLLPSSGSNNITVHIGLNGGSHHQICENVKAPVQSGSDEEAEKGLNDTLKNYKAELDKNIDELIADEANIPKINDICKKTLGKVTAASLKKDSLAISLNLPTLFNLYRVRHTCTSGSFPRSFEPLLITDKMREEANKVGLQLKLKATYDQDRFKELELFFIKRDGGGLEPVKTDDGDIKGKIDEEILIDAKGTDQKLRTIVRGRVDTDSQTEQGQFLEGEQCNFVDDRRTLESQLKESEKEKAALEERFQDLTQKYEYREQALATQHITRRVKREEMNFQHEFRQSSSSLKQYHLQNQEDKDSQLKEAKQEKASFEESWKELEHKLVSTEKSLFSQRPETKNSQEKLQTDKEEKEKLIENLQDKSGESSQKDKWSYTLVNGQHQNRGQTFIRPRGLAFYHDQLVVCDSGNSIVQILNKDFTCDKVLGSFDGQFAKPFCPLSVAISCINHFFILDDENNQIVVCDENSTIIDIITLPKNTKVVWDIALVGEFVLVTLSMTTPNIMKKTERDDRMVKYTQKGKHVAEVGGQGSDHVQFTFPVSVVVNSNNVIMVYDWGRDCIKCFDSNLKFLYEYGENQLRISLGGFLAYIAVDEDDNVYVCGDIREYIIKFRCDGKWICDLFKGDVKRPKYIAAMGDKIGVVEEYKAKVKIFFKR